MIQASFLASRGPNPVHLLRAAQILLRRVNEETQTITAETRKSLARSVRNLRACVRKTAQKTVERRLSSIVFEQAIEAEKRYREVVAQAHRDCLDVALAAARELVGEVFCRDMTPIAAKVRLALEGLLAGHAAQIGAAPTMVSAVKAALESEGISLPVNSLNDLPLDDIAVFTAHGSITLSWKDQYIEIARRLKSLLEIKLAEESR